MNPVTQGLLKQLGDPEATRFAEDWDQLEQLVIEVYRQKSVSFEQQAHFFAIKEKLQISYVQLERGLAEFWPYVKMKGERIVANPFTAVIRRASAKEFVENWDAMRTLPAAREALNQMLVARIEGAS